jgi:hypothetical protein
MIKTDYIDEAKRILPLISETKIKDEKTYLFVKSMKSKVKFNEFISDKCIYWLRDIKDRQLASEEYDRVEEAEKERYSDE